MSEARVLVGRYQLKTKLGSGGMGSVWRATDLTLKADVAVKLIDPSIAESPEALARFEREAQAAAAIRSTHVVQILEYGVDGNSPFIAMELLVGENLGARLKKAGRLSPGETSHILSHAARALSLAHQRDIVHRDLKPENIFIVHEEDEDIGKVLDFGIARSPNRLSEGSGLKTQTGAILGTPFYMSPEQATGQPVDSLSDIWSFGVIAFECLTGQRAFDGESLGSLFHAVCMAQLPVPSTIARVPQGFDEWFQRATARHKSERFQSIREAAEALRSVCSKPLGSQPSELARLAAVSIATLENTVSHEALTILEPHQRAYGKLPWAVGLALAIMFAGGAIYRLRRNPGDLTVAGISSAAHTMNLAQTVSLVTAASAPTHPVPSASAESSSAPSNSETGKPKASGLPPQKLDGLSHTRPAKGKSTPAADDDNVAAF